MDNCDQAWLQGWTATDCSPSKQQTRVWDTWNYGNKTEPPNQLSMRCKVPVEPPRACECSGTHCSKREWCTGLRMAVVLAYNLYSLDHWYQMYCQPSMMPCLQDTLVLPRLPSECENDSTGMVDKWCENWCWQCEKSSKRKSPQHVVRAP